MPHGGYRQLKSFQLSQLIYDLTVRFVELFIDSRSRTCDQMVQAARSGRQNIAEGSQASGTSKKTELKLTGVARASLEELRLDYEDFLRQNNLPQWEMHDSRRQKLIDARCQNLQDLKNWINGPDGRNGPSGHQSTTPEVAANAALVLLGVACALLDRQINRLAADFETTGGFTERLYRIRKQKRSGEREESISSTIVHQVHKTR